MRSKGVRILSTNHIFAIIGGVFLGGAVGLFVVRIKFDNSFVRKPGWESLLHLGVALCAALGVACMVLAASTHQCPNCDILVYGNYCKKCGYQVRAEEHLKELFCPECGADISDDSNFCGQCGVPVKEY